MSAILPVTPVGCSLGERHRHLSRLVEEAYKDHAPLLEFLALPEQSPLDRLFKIDLASKHRYVDYVIDNLKSEDMLYVSRCLKSKWLLDSQYRDIINPTYLEETLYPQMLSTAANKMKHWVQLHLRDPERCQQFYSYYVSKNFRFATNFLWHCSKNFVLSEAINFFEDMTPYHLKRILERHPEFCRTFFDSLKSNKTLLYQYMYHQPEYFKSVVIILKTETDLFLDITEKYFNHNAHSRFNAAVTKYIMKNRKNRFMNKPELYTGWLLDVGTVAKYLTCDETKQVLLNLARAEYLCHWFSYKNVEPLFKRLKVKDRETLKKQIFVEKSVGEKVKDWPYEPPSAPEFLQDYPNDSIFYDHEHSPREYEMFGGSYSDCCDIKFRCCLKKRKYGKWAEVYTHETALDQLYNRFRFKGFSQVLFELRKELSAASSVEDRMQIMLVLVSKTGGREDRVKELLDFLVTRHSNEPAHLRAAIVRSLVKRAAAWRLLPETWHVLIDFAHGLGLDGNQPEVTCNEGLHAVILRNLLTDSECSSNILDSFLRNFSKFSEYNLNAEEKRKVRESLPMLLLRASYNAPESKDAVKVLIKLFDVTDFYRIPVNDYPDVLSAVKNIADKDMTVAEELLRRLYNARIARKKFARENFELFQTNDSYLNALKHSPEFLVTEKFKELIPKCLHHDGFFKKLTIYFSESGGLAEKYLDMLQKSLTEDLEVRVARSLAILAGSSLPMKIQQFEKEPKGSVERKIASALKANCHLTRPRLDLDAYGWREAGLVAVANKLSVCRDLDIPKYVNELSKWPRAYKLMWNLARKGHLEVEIFPFIVKSRPILAFKVGLKFIPEIRAKFDITMWESLQNIIKELNLTKHEKLCKSFCKVNLMPSNIRAEYAIVAYNAFKKISIKKAMPILCEIENILPEVNGEFLSGIIQHFISEEFTSENIIRKNMHRNILLYIRVIAKFMLACRSDEEQKVRMTVCEPFLHKLKSLWLENHKREITEKIIESYISALKYSKVYLNTNFVSPLPVLQKVQIWLEEFLPIERYFGLHVHLGMLISFYNCVRRSVEDNPEIFSDQHKRDDEGLVIVGAAFGKSLSSNVEELADKTFPSIVQLYAAQVSTFLMNEFEYANNGGNSVNKFVGVILEEILNNNSNTHSLLLGILIFRELKYIVRKNKELLNILKKIVEPQVSFLILAQDDYIYDSD